MEQALYYLFTPRISGISPGSRTLEKEFTTSDLTSTKSIGPLPIGSATEGGTDIDGDHEFAAKAFVWQTSERHERKSGES